MEKSFNINTQQEIRSQIDDEILYFHPVVYCVRKYLAKKYLLEYIERLQQKRLVKLIKSASQLNFVVEIDFTKALDENRGTPDERRDLVRTLDCKRCAHAEI